MSVRTIDMLEIKELPTKGYEKVIEAVDKEAGLHAIIAVHNTSLGPSLGGVRIYPYSSVQEALTDALRLSKGMTYKSAIAEIGLGGGKAVLIANPKEDKTAKLLHSFAEAVNSLNGQYICAEDVGTTTDDMAVLSEKTHYVAALASRGSSGDPSPYTAWGVWRGMQAVALKQWNTTSLHSKTVAIQGLGKVGNTLAELLFWHGAELLVSDIDSEKLNTAKRKFGAEIISPEEIHRVKCDIFTPCAMGAILNDETIPELQCQAVAGSANNQLAEAHHADELRKRNILYAPDYVINAGGIINASLEFAPNGYNAKSARRKVNRIFNTLLDIFYRSETQQIATDTTAHQLAEYKLAYGIGKRQGKMIFHGKLDEPNT